jgi:hypothetical protein
MPAGEPYRRRNTTFSYTLIHVRLLYDANDRKLLVIRQVSQTLCSIITPGEHLFAIGVDGIEIYNNAVTVPELDLCQR